MDYSQFERELNSRLTQLEPEISSLRQQLETLVAEKKMVEQAIKVLGQR